MLCAGALASAPLGAPAATQDVRTLSTILNAFEVLGTGDADASASMSLTIRSDTGRLCWFLRAKGIDPPTAIHIHLARSGAPGPAVVTVPGARSNGCVSIPPAMAAAILAAPSDYYVDVHTATHPSGAIRGQFNN